MGFSVDSSSAVILENIIIRVYCNEGLINEERVDFGIAVTNDPPFIKTTLNRQKVKAGTQFSYNIPLNTFVDPDGDLLTYDYESVIL